MTLFSLTTLATVASTTGSGCAMDLDTAVKDDGTLSNDLLVTSAKARQSGEEDIAVGTMVVSRVNAVSE